MDIVYILHIKAMPGEEDIDWKVMKLMERKDMTLCLNRKYVCTMTREVYYHIRISRAMINRLRELIEAFVRCEELELFELTYW